MDAGPALSCSTQNSNATLPTAPPAPQEGIDTAIPQTTLMHTAQCHVDLTGLAASDASSKEPMHKAQQDETEEDTAIPLTNDAAEGYHHNGNESTSENPPIPQQPASSFNLRANSLAPLTALGSLFTPIRSLPTILTHALPFWKKDVQSQSQQPLQKEGQQQAVSKSGVDEDEQLGSPSALPAPHADPDCGTASEDAQPVISPVSAFPSSRRSGSCSPETYAVPELSPSPASSENDMTRRPASPADESTNAVDTAIAPPALQTAHRDFEMDNEENHRNGSDSDSEIYHPALSSACTNHLPSPPTHPSRTSTPEAATAPIPFLQDRRSEMAVSADASSSSPSPSPSPSPSSNANANPNPKTDMGYVLAPTSPISPHTPSTHSPATTADETLPTLPSPQPKRKRLTDLDLDQTPDPDQANSVQLLSGLQRFRARKRAKRAEMEDTLDLQMADAEAGAWQLQARVPAALRQAGAGAGVQGGRTRGLKGSVWEEWEEENDDGER